MASIKLNNGKDFPLFGLGTFMSAPGEVGKAVEHALEAGYRHIDGAYVYYNEAEIGAALKRCFDKQILKREELFFVTKLWNTKHRPADVKAALTAQLKDLQLAYVDLYLMHMPIAFAPGVDDFPVDDKGEPVFDEGANLVDTWKAMEKCVDDGLAKSIGISNFNSIQIREVWDGARIKPAVLQIEVQPYLQQDELIDFCQARGIAVTGYGNLGAPGKAWKDDKSLSVLEDEVILSIGKKYGKTPAQVCLRWLIQRKVSVIPKSTNANRIKSNFQIFDFELTADDMKQIKSLNRNERVYYIMTKVNGQFVEMSKSAPNYPFNIEF